MFLNWTRRNGKNNSPCPNRQMLFETNVHFAFWGKFIWFYIFCIIAIRAFYLSILFDFVFVSETVSFPFLLLFKLYEFLITFETIRINNIIIIAIRFFFVCSFEEMHWNVSTSFACIIHCMREIVVIGVQCNVSIVLFSDLAHIHEEAIIWRRIFHI